MRTALYSPWRCADKGPGSLLRIPPKHRFAAGRCIRSLPKRTHMLHESVRVRSVSTSAMREQNIDVVAGDFMGRTSRAQRNARPGPYFRPPAACFNQRARMDVRYTRSHA